MMARRRKPVRAELTEAQRQDIANRFSAGESAVKIAAEYGVHRTYPNKLVRLRGLPSRAGRVDVVLRLRAEVADLLQAEAARRHTSVNALCAEAIAAYVGATEQ